jgi:ribosomal protein L16 Arg81 hydroxylase
MSMPRPDYYHDLNTNAEILKSRVKALEEGAEKRADELGKTLKELDDNNQQLSKEAAVLRQQMAEQTKRLDEWDRRLWGLVVVLIGAILSLASGLIVTLAKK